MKRQWIVSLIAFLFLFFLISCSEEDEEPQKTTSQETSHQTTALHYHSISDEKSWDPDSSEALQVAILERGKGSAVKSGDLIKVHYRGQLWQDGQRGKEFDSSYSRQEPVEFSIGVGQVIPGWDKSLVGQTIGSKLVLIIPSEMAYGARGAGEAIPPHSNLVFDVEILDSSAPYFMISDEASWDIQKKDKLQIVLKKQGAGETVQRGDTIKVHYRGQHWKEGQRGEEFDSSYKRGQPTEFPIGIGRVIPGWDLGLVGQTVGTEITLIIPSQLAYGGRRDLHDLVFDVEILGTSH